MISGVETIDQNNSEQHTSNDHDESNDLNDMELLKASETFDTTCNSKKASGDVLTCGLNDDEVNNMF